MDQVKVTIMLRQTPKPVGPPDGALGGATARDRHRSPGREAEGL